MGLGMDSQGFFNLKCGCHPILDTFLPCRSCWWLAPFHTRSWGNLKRPVKVVDVPPRLTPTPTLDHTFWHILMEPLKLKGGKFGKDWKGPVLTFFQREIFAFRDSEGCYLFFLLCSFGTNISPTVLVFLSRWSSQLPVWWDMFSYVP